MDIYTYAVAMDFKYGKYWASCEAFPGLFGIGDSVQEAKASILATMRLYIGECIAENRPIPRAGTDQKETVSIAV